MIISVASGKGGTGKTTSSISLAAGLVYFVAMAVILADIIRSIPLIRRGSTRVTVLMVTLIGRVRIGLLSMIPNLTPIILVLGIIGVTPFKLDLFTMMVASIAIGLAVDDTIHFMHNFRRYYEQSGDPVKAVYETLHSTGRAMLVTTIVLSVGFFIFVFASMNNLFAFGLLTAFTIVMALAADYLVAPALMMLVHRGRKTAPEMEGDRPRTPDIDYIT